MKSLMQQKLESLRDTYPQYGFEVGLRLTAIDGKLRIQAEALDGGPKPVATSSIILHAEAFGGVEAAIVHRLETLETQL